MHRNPTPTFLASAKRSTDPTPRADGLGVWLLDIPTFLDLWFLMERSSDGYSWSHSYECGTLQGRLWPLDMCSSTWLLKVDHVWSA